MKHEARLGFGKRHAFARPPCIVALILTLLAAFVPAYAPGAAGPAATLTGMAGCRCPMHPGAGKACCCNSRKTGRRGCGFSAACTGDDSTASPPASGRRVVCPPALAGSAPVPGLRRLFVVRPNAASSTLPDSLAPLPQAPPPRYL